MDNYAEFRTDDLPAEDRFAGWHDMTRQSFVPSIIQGTDQHDFRARMRRLDLGDVQVSAVSMPSLRMTRPMKLIRHSDPELLMLWLHLDGTFSFGMSGRPDVPQASGFLLYETSRPYHGVSVAGPGPVQGLVVQLPRARLPAANRLVEPLLGSCLPTQDGIGALTAGFFTDLIGRAEQLSPGDMAQLDTISLEMLTALFRSHSRSPEATAAMSAQTLRVAVRQHIDRHLHRPDLSPRTIAAAHRVSLRHLHRIFEDEDESVAALIRHRRLERCRTDLADPGLFQRTVQSIATAWGFVDGAHFSRVFRARYGVSPRAYRQSAVPRGGRHLTVVP